MVFDHPEYIDQTVEGEIPAYHPAWKRDPAVKDDKKSIKKEEQLI